MTLEAMLNILIYVVSPVVIVLVTRFYTMRKMMADASGKEIENSAKICEMWKNLSEGMEKRFKEEIDELRKQNCELESQVKAVMKENEDLHRRMHELEEENVRLIRQLKILNNAKNGQG